MAQGLVKKSKVQTSKANQRKAPTGNRVIKPKKASLQKVEKMKKKHSAGLIAATERSLAGKVGHLEILGGGKREKKGAGKEEGKSKKPKS